MKCLVVFLLTIAAVSTVQAATFEWVDSAGVVHFTDDPDRVPAKYRSRAKERESMKGEETGNAAPQQPGPVAQQPVTPAQQELYQGHDEAWWRSAFSVLRKEQKTLQDGLPGKREQLAAIHHRRIVYQKARDRVAYNDLSQEIKTDEARIKELQDKLAVLERDATASGVPKEWRQ